MMQENKDKRPSLLELFVPPANDCGIERRGIFGLMCALSADTVFMGSIMSAFTGLTSRQRERFGRISMALFLDGSHGQIEDMPGQAWGYPVQGKPSIELMHAKVALLGFGPAVEGKPNYYRLVVFTGNWTTHAVNSQINIVWYCDYDTTVRKPAKQEAADIHACIDFWRTLLALDSGTKGYYRLAQPVRDRTNWFLKHIENSIPKPSETWTARFISNITADVCRNLGIFAGNSIGAQVLKRICCDKKTRNFICCGSGFYEKAGKIPKEPEVLRDMVCILQKRQGGLTKKLRHTYKYLVLNVEMSGAVGYWLKKGDTVDSWVFYRPCITENPSASLHAKYLFMANWVPKTERYTSGVLYIGSANISKQGFALSPGTGGNIEVGVFLEVNECLSEEDLCTRLGIGDEEVDSSDISDEIEDETGETGSLRRPPLPPVSYLTWNSESRTLSFTLMDGNDQWKILTIGGKSIDANGDSIVFDVENPGFSIELIAEKEGQRQSWRIPIFLRDGTFCTPAPVSKKAHEILASLVDFPDILPEDDESEDEREPEDSEQPGGSKNDNSTGRDLAEERKRLSEFPLHLATTLVETIAYKNQSTSEAMMPDWVAHLRRLLLQEMDLEETKKLQSLEINFLEPLIKVSGFAPPIRTADYQRLIDDVRQAWWPDRPVEEVIQ